MFYQADTMKISCVLRVMSLRSKITVIAMACLSFTISAAAQNIDAERIKNQSLQWNTAHIQARALEQGYLRVHSSFWSPFGVEFTKNGNVIGPHWLQVIPNDAVNGSGEALIHAKRARLFQGFVLGTSIVGTGLVIGGLAVEYQNHEWTRGAKLMALGGIAVIAVQIVCALARDREMLLSVNAYNYDLVRGGSAE